MLCGVPVNKHSVMIFLEILKWILLIVVAIAFAGFCLFMTVMFLVALGTDLEINEEPNPYIKDNPESIN